MVVVSIFTRQKGVKAKKQPDPSIYRLIGVSAKGQSSGQQIAERCVLLMLNEAARCFDEQVIRSARDGDIGAVFGIGFPPFFRGAFPLYGYAGRGKRRGVAAADGGALWGTICTV